MCMCGTKKMMGMRFDQYSSLFDALSGWVETSTAIAVRLQQSGQLERIESKRFLQRWDKLVIVDQPFRDQE